MPRLRLFLLLGSSILWISQGFAQTAGSKGGPPPPAAQTTNAPTGSNPQAASSPVPTFRANANLVLLDVVVRAKTGPVVGLKQPDFQVLEEGRPQRVTVFEEHRATDAPETVSLPQLPPHVYSNAPQYTLTSAANVLLLDGLNTPLSDQVYIRRRMLEYLSTIPPGTRIAVFTLGSKLHIITGFTTDAAQIAKAIGSGRGTAERSAVLDSDFDNLMNLQIAMGQALGLSSYAMSGIQQFISDTQNFTVALREEMTIDALDQISRYLSTMPGRKNLIWFSASFPLRFMQGGVSPNMDPMADLTGAAKKAAELLALSRVAVYPVDSRGLLNVPGIDASATAGVAKSMLSAPSGASGQGAIGQGGGGNTGIGGANTGIGSYSMDQVSGQQLNIASEPGVGGEVEQNNQTFMNDMAWDHFNMEQIATETGGKAYFNRNALGQIVGEAVANGSSYYTLGYTPEDRDYNGALRHITVNVAGGRYDLEYRHAYYAERASQTLHGTPGRRSPLIDAMQHGLPPLSQVLFKVRVLAAGSPDLKTEVAVSGPAGALAAGLKKPQRYMVDFWIDPRTLDHTTLPDGKVQTQVELTEVAYDEEGIRQNYADQGLSISQTPDQAAAAQLAGLPLHEQIDLPAGNVYLRIGVHDLLGGSIGTIEIPVVAGK